MYYMSLLSNYDKIVLQLSHDLESLCKYASGKWYFPFLDLGCLKLLVQVKVSRLKQYLCYLKNKTFKS